MKHFLFVILLFITNLGVAQLWSENFSSNIDGDATGNDNNLPSGADWTTSYGGAGTFDVRSNVFEANWQMDALGTWTSEVIDISSVDFAEITMDISWFGSSVFSGVDSLRVYYKLDARAEILMFSHNTGFLSTGGSTSLSQILEGSSVQIIIRAIHQGLAAGSYYRWDNIVVQEVVTLYAMVDGGNWGTNSTWSLDPYAGPPQTAFTGTVNGTQRMIIGDGASNDYSINFDNDASVRYLEVEDGSSLTWSGGDHTMTFSQPGAIVIADGGYISDGANSGQVTFDEIGSTNSIQVNDATTGLEIDQLNLIQDRIILNISGTGVISLSGDLLFNEDDCTLENGASINAVDLAANFGDNGNVLNNVGTLDFVDVNINNSNLEINNSGIINQSGTFVNGEIDGGSDFNNLDGATWNYGGTGHDLGTDLFCNNGTNSFNYTSAAAQQVITPNDNYVNMTVSGGGTITLLGAVDLSGTLTLSSGIVSTTAANILTFLDGALWAGGSTSSYIDGPTAKVGNDAFVFPTGDNGVWARIGISAPGVVTDQFTAEYFDANYGDQTVDIGLDHVSYIEYWTLDRDVGTSSVTVTLYSEDNDRSGITAGEEADLRVARWGDIGGGSFAWIDEGGTGPTPITSGTVADFSPFTFGSAAGSNPLPIELLSFNAVAKVNHIQLNWATAAEINNDFFTIERSTNATEWDIIATVEGAGNSSIELEYQHQDFSPIPGISYYRLRQTDYDGQFEVFSPVLVVYEPAQQMTLFPNPTADLVQINSSVDLNSSTIVLRDMNGRAIFTSSEIKGFSTKIATDKLPDGIYMLEIGYESGKISEKLVIKR